MKEKLKLTLKQRKKHAKARFFYCSHNNTEEIIVDERRTMIFCTECKCCVREEE